MEASAETKIIPPAHPATVFSKLVRICLGPPRPVDAGTEHRKRPARLLYDVDEPPPLGIALVIAIQHVLVLSVGWVYIVVLVTSFGGTTAQSQAIIRICMIITGVATILQARSHGPIGASYLCPVSPGSNHLPTAILAAKAGGLPLVFGMTSFSGVVETVLSRFVRRLRAFFPPEVTGLVVAMIGIQLIRLAFSRFFGFQNQHADSRTAIVATITLMAMVLPTISRSRLRLAPVLIGLAVGYLASVWLGVLSMATVRAALAVPWFDFPDRVPGWGWKISPEMMLPFAIASLSAVLKGVGDITFCQKLNDAEWKRTDMNSASGGILTPGLSNIVGGAVGGIPHTTSSSAVGLTSATGVTSRSVAVPLGLLLIGLAFVPKLAALFSVVPTPVMGAVMVYIACFITLGGLQVLTSRMLDNRRVFVVGISLLFGLSVEIVPGLYQQLPAALHPLFSSALSLGTVLAVLLNMLFRIGVARTHDIVLQPGTDNVDTVSAMMEEQGATWGMRKEVCTRVAEALHEFLVALQLLGVTAPVKARLRFDELKLTAALVYAGPAMIIPKTPPTAEDLVSGRATVTELSTYMLRQHADRVRVSHDDGSCRVYLHFDH
ncbi:MAG TPA: solute carrier family 23 protein [Candidatus Acidoferrales bacterium]